ncbi:integrase/recombinase xerD homolog [Pleurodeles waltl]|uniref:integrase/recombinase xerD homolog n=1 Tax=Pleurodeles waltl TaxID=8319 RepID=UPI003709893B
MEYPSGCIGPVPSVGPPGSSEVGILEDFRSRWHDCRLSQEAQTLISQAWAPGTGKRYKSAWSRWASWCLDRHTDPFGAHVTDVLNFLAELAASGLSYCTVNSFRSAISTGHPPLEGYPVGSHPWVCRLLKEVRLSRPPHPRYSEVWDVNLVLRLLSSWQDNSFLSRKQLSAKLAVLLCLISCKRVSDVRALDVTARVFSPEGVTFMISRRTKCGTRSVSYPAFPFAPKLCVVRCLKTYEEVRAALRTSGENQLLISVKKPFKEISSPTIARWVRWILSEAGVDIQVFGAHSTQGAMASKAVQVGGRLEDIMNAADWSSESVFKQFYFKPIHEAASLVLQAVVLYSADDFSHIDIDYDQGAGHLVSDGAYEFCIISVGDDVDVRANDAD